jgi:hypothetical protein
MENHFAEAVKKASASGDGVEHAAAHASRYLTGMIRLGWCARSWAERKAFAAEVLEKNSDERLRPAVTEGRQ